MIRVEALWLSVAPLDMRAGMDTITKDGFSAGTAV